jgi:excisionase family DNA binding protein
METTMDMLRTGLERARHAALDGDVPAVLRELDQAIASIEADRLLTTTEAARLLGIRSPNTILAWCRTGYVHGVKRGGRTLIPLSEVERIKDSDPVHATKVADDLHDRSAAIGSEGELTDAEMEVLHGTRPGSLPWERAQEATG